MRQAKALKILTDNLDDIKREFGVKSIGDSRGAKAPYAATTAVAIVAPRAPKR